MTRASSARPSSLSPARLLTLSRPSLRRELRQHLSLRLSQFLFARDVRAEESPPLASRARGVRRLPHRSRLHPPSPSSRLARAQRLRHVRALALGALDGETSPEIGPSTVARIELASNVILAQLKHRVCATRQSRDSRIESKEPTTSVRARSYRSTPTRARPPRRRWPGEDSTPSWRRVTRSIIDTRRRVRFASKDASETRETRGRPRATASVARETRARVRARSRRGRGDGRVRVSR